MSVFIATFFTHYGAVSFNRYCKEHGVASKMMPVPRFLSSSCGTCVRFEAETWDLGFDDDDALDGVFRIEGEHAQRIDGRK
jgi:hypothetical protein